MIKDIDHVSKNGSHKVLKIENCKRLTNFQKLGKIKQSLTISRCPGLKVFTGLERIPTVSVVSCLGLHDFSCLAVDPSSVMLLGPTAQATHQSTLGLESSIPPLNAPNNDNTASLQKLSITGGEFSYNQLVHLASVKQLEFLEINPFNDIPNTFGMQQERLSFSFNKQGLLSSLAQVSLYKNTLQDMHLYQFQYLDSLTIQNLSSLKDVSCLGCIHSLNLDGCKNIENIDGLGYGNYSLSLVNCINISSVNHLSSVHILNLTGCYKVSDVSNLGEVFSLNLSYCHRIIDFSALGQHHYLNLSNTLVRDVNHLFQVYELDLKCCNSIEDASYLIHVPILRISGSSLENISTLIEGRKIPEGFHRSLW
jgi:hypothetical protein